MTPERREEIYQGMRFGSFSQTHKKIVVERPDVQKAIADLWNENEALRAEVEALRSGQGEVQPVSDSAGTSEGEEPHDA